MRSALSLVISSALVVSACVQVGSTDPTAPITPPPPATTPVGVGCEDGVAESPPASAESITRSEGDFDGDGRLDEVEVYLSGGEWWARTTFDSGYAAEVSLGNGAIAYAVGGLDLDDSGDEFLVVIGSGASATIVGIYTMAGCELVSVVDGAGAPVAIPVGASAVNQSGLRCIPGVGIDVFTQTTSDGITHRQIVERFRLVDGRLVSEGSVTETLVGPDDRTRILDASRFDCAGLSL